jgi:hypothetical protein
MIIGLSGYAKSGKDTVAAMIQEHYAQSAGSGTTYTDWQIKKFSGKLKVIASLLTGIPVEKFEDQEFKESILGVEWDMIETAFGDDYVIDPMSVREFLQLLGTDAIRYGLHPNAWVNALMADYITEEKVYDLGGGMKHVSPPSKWIVTDVRFPNEAKAIKDRGGVIVRIDRPGISPVNAHESETALDNWTFDFKIANVSDLVSLRQSVEVLLNKLPCKN